MTDRWVFDCDGHVRENDRELFEYLPPPFAGQSVLLDNPFIPRFSFNRTASRIVDNQGRVTIPASNVRAKDWLSYLDEFQIAGTVLFPSQGLSFGLIPDPDWAAAVARAYNDWLHDQFLRHNPRRLYGVALIPLQDPERAVAELRRAVGELGMVGAILPTVGLWEAYGHRMYWPVYEAAQELGCALVLHGGPAYGMGLERLHTLIETRTLSHVAGQQVQMTSMVLSGIFDVFPKLRVAYCEAGMGWVPYLVERLDLEYRNRRRQAPNLKTMPSELFQRGQIFVGAELAERALPFGIDFLGEDCFISASDFPHEPRPEYPEAIETLERRTDISARAKHKILWENALRLYGIDEATLQAAVDWAEVPASS